LLDFTATTFYASERLFLESVPEKDRPVQPARRLQAEFSRVFPSAAPEHEGAAVQMHPDLRPVKILFKKNLTFYLS